VDLGIFALSYNTNSSLGSRYSQLVHFGLEIATFSLGTRTADAKAATLVPLVTYGNSAGL
jgi:hypothetical protein